MGISSYPVHVTMDFGFAHEFFVSFMFFAFAWLCIAHHFVAHLHCIQKRSLITQTPQDDQMTTLTFQPNFLHDSVRLSNFRLNRLHLANAVFERVRSLICHKDLKFSEKKRISSNRADLLRMSVDLFMVVV